MRNTVAVQSSESPNVAATRRVRAISPELSEVLHMLNALESKFEDPDISR